MNYRVRRHVDVESDIMELATWIARDSREAACRFFDAVETSLTGLRFMPGRGARKDVRDRTLTGVKSLAIGGFPNHLIIYEVRVSRGECTCGRPRGSTLPSNSPGPAEVSRNSRPAQTLRAPG